MRSSTAVSTRISARSSGHRHARPRHLQHPRDRRRRARPSTAGRAQQGEVAIRDPRIAVTSLTGTAALTADRLEFQDVRANVNGGTMQASGWVQHRGFTLSDGSIRFIGRRLAVELPEHLRS
jgi:hypothetical protein